METIGFERSWKRSPRVSNIFVVHFISKLDLLHIHDQCLNLLQYFFLGFSNDLVLHPRVDVSIIELGEHDEGELLSALARMNRYKLTCL